MIGVDPRTVTARAVLHGLVQDPAPDALLPLLALSVMTTTVPFSAAEIADVAKQVAVRSAKAGSVAAAELILSSCGRALDRCGASQQAADLLETSALVRWRDARRKAQ